MRGWYDKFRNAFRGIAGGLRNQNSFLVHIPAAAAAIAAGLWFQISAAEWGLVLLSIGLVVGLELINSSLETLVRHLTPERHPAVGAALDMAAGGVLVGALAAAAVGVTVFAPRVLEWLGSA